MEHTRPSITPPPDLAPFIFPGESIINITDSPERQATQAPSGLRELYRLAQAKIHDEVGEFGPTLASLALEDNSGGDDTVDLHRYEALFGRDSLRVAIDLLPLYPRLTRATIMALAELQGVQYDKNREEEPGRIIHESRKPDDPIAQQLTKEYGWDWPYYGSVDATPEFIRTIAAYCKDDYEGDAFLFQKYNDKNGTPRIIADALTFAIDWLTRRMDTNPEGLLESLSTLPLGIENQVWKDSWDSYFHSDGTIADHHRGVASIEAQRVSYDALLDGAELYERVLGKTAQADELRDRAANLKKVIFSTFWTDDKEGYFVLGTDRNEKGALQPLSVRTSNMGHVLHSRLLEGDGEEMVYYRKAIIRHLFSSEMLADSGIRTLASDEVRFRPGAYHNGSVWLWDTHFIARGLRRHGYNHLADNLSERLFHIIDVTKRFPEFVRGDGTPEPTLNTRIVDVWDEKNQRTNRIEQPPQEVQAWSVAAILAMKHYNAMNYKTERQLPKDSFEAAILDTIPRIDDRPHQVTPRVRHSSTQTHPATDTHHQPQIDRD